MSKSRILQALALEELEDDTLEGDEVAEVAEPEEIVEGAEEVQEAEAEVEESADVVEELGEASETLESIYYALEAHQEEGLSPQAAQFAKMAIDQATARIGEVVDIPSHEAFEGSSRSVQSTELSMEGIIDTLKSIWAKIKSWILRVWEAIKNFFKRWFTQAGRVKAKAENFAKYAAKLTGDPKNNKVKIGKSLAAQVAINSTLGADPNGSFVDSTKQSNMTKAFSNMNAALNDAVAFDNKFQVLAKETAKATSAAVKELAKNDKNKDKDEGEEDAIKKLQESAKDVFTAASNAVDLKAFFSLSAYSVDYKENGKKVGLMTPPLPGNVHYYIKENEKVKLKNIFVSQFQVGKIKGQKSINKDFEVPVASVSAIQSGAEAIKKLIDKALDVRAKSEKAIDGAKNTLGDVQLSGDFVFGQFIPNTTMSTLRRLLSHVGKQSSSLVSHALSYSNAMINFYKVSASQYKKA